MDCMITYNNKFIYIITFTAEIEVSLCTIYLTLGTTLCCSRNITFTSKIVCKITVYIDTIGQLRLLIVKVLEDIKCHLNHKSIIC